MLSLLSVFLVCGMYSINVLAATHLNEAGPEIRITELIGQKMDQKALYLFKEILAVSQNLI